MVAAMRLTMWQVAWKIEQVLSKAVVEKNVDYNVVNLVVG